MRRQRGDRWKSAALSSLEARKAIYCSFLPPAFSVSDEVNRRGAENAGAGVGVSHFGGESQMGKALGAVTEKLYLCAFSHLQPHSLYFTENCHINVALKEMQKALLHLPAPCSDGWQ